MVGREWIGKLLAGEARSAIPDGADSKLPFRGSAVDAAELASRLELDPQEVRLSVLAAAARSDRERLQAALREVQVAEKAERQISPAGRWLLDNFHLIEEQLDELEHLGRREAGRLPAVRAGISPGGGLPRVWALAREYVAQTDSRFSADSFAQWVGQFQSVAPLQLAELWSLPLALRAVLVENLRRIAVRVEDSLRARRHAESFALQLSRAAGEGAAAAPPEPGPGARDPFLLQLARQLQRLGPEAATARNWLEEQLAAHRLSVDDLAQREHVSQGANNVSISQAITSLRAITATDWREFVERASLVDEALRQTPGYLALDFLTRDRYRQALCELARGASRPELEVAEALVQLTKGEGRSNDLGQLLLTTEGRARVEASLGYVPRRGQRIRRALQRYAVTLYLGSLALVTAALLATVAELSGLPTSSLTVLLLLALLPASDIAVALVNHLLQKAYPPRHLPRLELADGVPESMRTLVVMPVLFRDRALLESQLRQLEVHALANADAELTFALLADWPDADVAVRPGDADLLAYAGDQVRELNIRHWSPPEKPRFFVLARRRIWSAGENCYMGWERKRGKLCELNLLLRGVAGTTWLPEAQGASLPENVRYVITLDADTRVPPGSLRRLIGTAAHPLNLPQADHSGIVRRGYGMLQPRVTPLLPMREERSIYRDIVSGSSGLDPYAGAVSDLYQDLFGEGSFTGKGLYDVDVFTRALQGRVPEGRVLSHDLLEGLHARCALVSDVEFFEEFPSHSEVAAARHHRWTRGDWQLLPWLFGKRAKLLGPLAVWKLLDNLRRSLSAPAALALAVIAPAIAFRTPAPWWALVTASLLVPALLPLLDGLAHAFRGRASLRTVAADFLRDLRAAGMNLAMLAQNAALMMDAIARALYRQLVSRRRLLEWVTAAQARAAAGYGLGAFVWPLRSASLVVTLTVLLLVFTYPTRLWALAPLLLLWWLAPLIARSLSLPRPESKPLELLSPGSRHELRSIARTTWRFFEEFVTEGERHLPPDNFQEDPEPVVAHRTSPTNIGLYLLAVTSARDLGWVGARTAVRRLVATMASLRELPKYRGHLYNWYETRTGAVLQPPYVSTVDSGNYAGNLLALRQFCLEEECRTLLRPAGLHDAWRELDRTFARVRAGAGDSAAARALESRVAAAIAAIEPAADDHPTGLLVLKRWMAALASVRELDDLLAVWEPARGPKARALHDAAAMFRRDLESLTEDARALVPACVRAADGALDGLTREDFEVLLATPLQSLPAAAQSLADSAPGTEAQGLLREGAAAVEALLEELRTLAAEAGLIVEEMDFRFLFDEQRKLFSIGYREREGELDAGRYDLLASEARLASLVAIAKGDVVPEHWFRLGRRQGPTRSGDVLLSWSGSMFEYLMPSLLMEEPPGSLLDQTLQRVVNEQIAYGTQHGVPWGVSESALNLRDRELTYQYSAFGVPGLGLKPGLAGNRVIAPYATGLAAWYAPLAVVANFQRLESLGARGPYGFREAIDFTPERLVPGQTHAVVNAYMAHHQGMTLAALTNLLLEGRLRSLLHADPKIQAVELLLQERPGRKAALPLPEEAPSSQTSLALAADPAREFALVSEAGDSVQWLSNRHFATMLTGWGAGYSTFEGKALTRWRGDLSGERQGQFFHLRIDDGPAWSATVEPQLTPAQGWQATMADHEVAYTRNEQGIESRLQVIVSPADNVELRRLTLVNRRSSAVRITVTTVCEVVLAPLPADRAHPAFSKLFVQTEGEAGALLARRRPRSDEEPTLWMAQALTGTVRLRDVESESGLELDELTFETDRARFIGRGRDAGSPAAVADRAPLSNTTGTVLDPVFAYRVVLTIEPGASCRLQLATAAAAERAEALRLVREQGTPGAFDRTRSLAWTAARAELHHLQLAPGEARNFQRLAGHLLRLAPELRLPTELLSANQRGAPSLWRFGLSGDRPIVVLRCDQVGDAEMLRTLLRGQEYLRTKWLIFDVVVLIENAHSYQQDVVQVLSQVAQLERPVSGAEAHPRRGDCHLLRREDLSAEEFVVVLAAANVVLFASHGSLAEQLSWPQKALPAPGRRPRVPRAGAEVPPLAEGLEFQNGLGGFARDGREYVIRLAPGEETPAPWCNVIANEQAGCIVSERGSCTSWSANSRENRLTPWSNDPVSDPTGEAIYLRDEENGALWSPTAAPIRVPDATYVARHGQGYSRFETLIDGIATDLAVFVPPREPARLMGLRITNRSARRRRLGVSAYAEWVLGDDRARHGPHIQTDYDEECGALFARNPWNTEFAGRVAFADLGGRQTTWTSRRREFLGQAALAAAPEALIAGAALSQFTGAGVDACAALQTMIELEPGESASLCFVLGQCENELQARETVRRLRLHPWTDWLADATAEWERRLSRVEIRTPDRALDLLVNRWLPYQAIVCRLWARSAFYQSGGAYGFRDQLQDCLLVMHYEPALARAQILRAAGRQFEAGDVQHWWHPPSGRGVRTHFSDDRLWLPYVLSAYLDRTGDIALLDEVAPFIAGPGPAPGHEDAHYQPETLERTASVYEHAALTIDASLEVGAHGLPLIGCGDWNDGMNRIGKDGRGESVWLGWFQSVVLRRFATLARERGETERARGWDEHARAVVRSIEVNAWDGAWYRRAWFDDGTPLGTAEAAECRIDAIAQSWSVFSGMGDRQRSRLAMQSVDAHLVQPETDLLLLLAPPFDRLPKDPGYIKGYPPGLRENGGQYTHAAVWTAMATALIGEPDRAVAYLDAINPMLRTTSRRGSAQYRIEPYVLAGDVYSTDPHAGRGGWSWYTGAAAWYWRATVECVLGVEIGAHSLRLSPRLPSHWNECAVHLEAPAGEGRSARYRIEFRRDGTVRGIEARLDGAPVNAERVPLLADGREHVLDVRIGPH